MYTSNLKHPYVKYQGVIFFWIEETTITNQAEGKYIPWNDE